MYSYSQQQQPFSPPSTAYASPPGSQDPYRASPVPMSSRQPYTSALSPPPPNGGFAPMGAGGPPGVPGSSRYGGYGQQAQPYQYASRSGGARYPSSSPYSPAPPSNGYPALPVPPQQTPQQKFKGTLAPGTVIKVENYHVRIEKYLSEGGYAHVYLTTSEMPIYPPRRGPEADAKKGRWGEKGYSTHCLKRIAFEDEKVWADVRREIEVMKALPSNPHLTQFLASAHSRLPNGGYEVFILMEFCSGGGIIDLLNKRLRDRLQEIEILNIFTDVCEAVAAMHHLKQPLLHRDLKIENVLSAPSGQPPSPKRPTPLIFKLCDFGSTTFPSNHPPQNKIEADSLAMDLNKHTTLQYRSPEMVEPMLGWAVGLPSDVWALGVLLYKLCYYTTPFEEHGTLAIVNAKYTFPQYPVYSPRIQHLIASMLVDHPARRPSVFEVLAMAHDMSGTQPEVDYPLRSRSFSASSPSVTSQQPRPGSGNLLDFTSPPPTSSAPAIQPDLAATVQPQRRGRPTRDPSQKSISTLPTAIPAMPAPPTISIPSESIPRATEEKKPGIPAPTLQVTGEKAQPAKQPSLDAFGAPKKPAAGPVSPGAGFGDSFGGPKPAVQNPNQNFAPPGRSAAPQTQGPAMTSNPPTKPVSAPNPGGELSFDVRFPSIESLDAEFSPPAPSFSPANLVSPIVSPPTKSPAGPGLQVKPSMMGHLTGETVPNHQVAGAKLNGAPQPRSTQVTGTAFKGTPSMSSSLDKKDDYFEQQPAEGIVTIDTSKDASVKTPVDLMTGDEHSSMTSPSAAQPTIRAPLGNDRPTPPTSNSRPYLPTLQTGRSAQSNLTPDSANSRFSDRPSPKQLKSAGGQSSDEDGPPESASGTGQRPITPARKKSDLEKLGSSFSERRAAFMGGANRDVSPTKTANANTVPAPTETRPAAVRHLSTERQRPQSLFIPPGAKPLVSPTMQTPPSAYAQPSQSRPGHGRKGSISEMVERFEGIQAPSSASNQFPPTAVQDDRSPAGSGMPERDEKPASNLGRKPSVATKPQALRKATIDSASTEVSKEVAEAPISPVKPSIAPKPKIADKPVLAPKPGMIKHGDMPSVLGYSKSSSGRSFPISKRETTPPKPESVEAKPEAPPADADSRKGSPEKQQSVGSLIARWNKGG